MPIPLSDAELAHLCAFIGYGRLDAPVWFLGMEEAGGGEANLRARLQFERVEDCAHAHQLLHLTRFHGEKAVIQRTWRGMCYVMLRLAGLLAAREDIRRYQAQRLGRIGGDTLLLELMPLPKPAVQRWEYTKLIPQYRGREEYYRLVMPARMRLIRQLCARYRPQVIVAYGKAYWGAYARLFGLDISSASGPLWAGWSGAMRVVLCDHFTARAMNGRLDELVGCITG